MIERDVFLFIDFHPTVGWTEEILKDGIKIYG